MFYMPVSYSQTESEDLSGGELQQQQQACLEGQVFNPETLTCEPSGEQIPTQECPEGQVFNEQTLTCEPSGEQQPTTQECPEGQVFNADSQICEPLEQVPAEDTTGTGTTTDTTKPLYQSQQFNCNPNSDTLQVGSQGNKVIELQTYLTDLGYGDLLEPEKIDGKFGPHTKNAVMAYQQDFGLTGDGIVGPQTWGSLCQQISLLPTTFPTPEGVEQQRNATEGEQIPADQKPPTTTTGQQQPPSPPVTDLEELTTTGQKAPPPSPPTGTTTTGQKAPPPSPPTGATDLEQLIAPGQQQPLSPPPLTATTTGQQPVPVGKNEVGKITKLDLKSGNTGDDIGILQKNLKELGYYPYDVVDKKFGSQTEMSVRLFQISNKLPLTGILDKITQEKMCTASTDKNKHRELILNNFVKNPNVSTLDLLKDGQKFKQFKWHANDFIGAPKGPNENETIKLVNSLKSIILEDRVSLPPNAILLNATYQQDKIKYNDYFYKQTQKMKDFPQRMNKHVIAGFDKMRETAKADGIEIVPLSVWRDPVVDEKRAKEAKNPYAIGGISHALGVTVDIKMSDGNKKYVEGGTKPFSQVVDMRGSSIHKWLAIFAKDFNFHPYTHEPWHWEYNYKGFKDVFFTDSPELKK